MPKQQHINVLQNGVIKNIDFTPFGGIDGFLQFSSGNNTDNTFILSSMVPWFNKGVVMTGNAVAQLPYEIRRGDEVVPLENAWGGVDNPQTLIYKIAASLCGGKAYVLIESIKGGIVDLRYLSPHTVKPNFDKKTGMLINFTRTVNGNSEPVEKEKMLYFWLPDDTVEIGEAKIHPIKNASLSAGLIYALDDSLRQYGERGFIPPTILAVKGMTNPSDVEKTERWWNAFLRGWTKTVAKIINAETVTPSVVGAGMDELRGSYIEITRQQIENIAASFNIPLGLFLSNAANYATMGGDRKTWYETGVFVLIYQTIEDVFSEQLFSRWDMDMIFMPESLDAFQDDENAKAGSVGTLQASFTADPAAALIAMDVLGYDLTEEQRTAIEALTPEPAPIPDTTTQDVIPVDGTPFEIQPSKALPSDEENAIASELLKWREFARKPHKREFDTKHIPPALAMRINVGLRSAKSEGEIQGVFDTASNEIPVIMLAKAIDRTTAVE